VSTAAVSPVIPAPTVDADNPWPGLLAFTEGDEAFFHGRQDEVDELCRLLPRQSVTVLFGVSGLGKTSLLRAGLFPRLRAMDYVPVYLRLDHTGTASPTAQVREAIEKSGAEAPPFREGEDLWSYLHREGNEWWTPNNRVATPVFVFDQFEETFTSGLQGRYRDRTRAFLAELACLIEGLVPADLRTQLIQVPERAESFSLKSHPYRVILSLREDFLPELEGLRASMPSITSNRLRLRRMSGPQALRVVNAAGEALVPPEVAEAVVRFVETAPAATPLDELEIEPALLSLLCRELNERRKARGEASFSQDLLASSSVNIIEDFYERSVKDLGMDVIVLLEDRLVTEAGLRNSLEWKSAVRAAGGDAGPLETLVDRRVLRVEDRGRQRQVELIHDRLAMVASEKGRERRQRLKIEQEHADAERQRRETAERRRGRLTFIFGFLAPLALLTALLFAGQRAWVRGEDAAREAMVKQTLMNDLGLARMAAAAIRNNLEAVTLAVTREATQPGLGAVVEGGGQDLQAYVEDVCARYRAHPERGCTPASDEDDIFSWSLADRRGILVARGPFDPKVANGDFSFREWFTGVREGPGRVAGPPRSRTGITSPFHSAAAGAGVLVSVASPIIARSETVVGVLSATVNVRRFDRILKSMEQPADADGCPVRFISVLVGDELASHPSLPSQPKGTEGFGRRPEVKRLIASPGAMMRDYEDPLCEGSWLASYQRLHLGYDASSASAHSADDLDKWIVVVEQRETEAVSPMDDLHQHLAKLGARVAIWGLAMLALLWVVLYYVNREAPLPIGLTGQGR
jgi:conflict system STAND superfamily ATPase